MLKSIFYDWGGANVWLFHAINNVRGDLIDRLMLLGTLLGAHQNFPVYAGLLALAALIAIGLSRAGGKDSTPITIRWFAVLSVFSLAFLLDAALTTALKHVFDFPRPPLALPPDSLHIVGRPEFHYSLPSGHSAFAALVAACFWPVLPRGGRMIAVLFVIWVGLSRVSLGAHFPADVAAGVLIGLASAGIVRPLVNRTIRHGTNSI